MKAIVIALLLMPVVAWADYRDGCPAGRVVRRFDAAQFGAAPDRESVMTTDRVEVGMVNTFYTSRDGLARSHGNSLSLQGVESWNGWLLHVWGEGTHRGAEGGISDAYLWENTVVAVGHRFAHLGELDRHDLGQDRTFDIPTLRQGWAFQVFGGRSWMKPDPNNISDDAIGLREAGIRSAFDGYMRDPGYLVGASLEWRYEIIGCMAPFFHVRVAPAVTGISDAFTMISVPATMAIGVSVSDDATIYVQYGLALRNFDGESMFTNALGQVIPIGGTRAYQRARLGVESRVIDHLHVGASVDYTSGQDGIFSGVYLIGGTDP